MKIFLSAVETYLDAISKSNYKNLLTSFYYRNGAKRAIDTLGGKREIMVDSGAYSFFSQRLKDAASTVKSATHQRTALVNLDNYVNEYKEFIKKWRDKVNYFVELDIDVLVGKEKLLEIRESLREVAGEKLIPAYHATMGSWEENRDELFRYDYVALEGIAAGGKPRIPYMQCIRDCYENGKKVHVFAMTKVDFLEKYPIYSTDSISWKSVAMWGRSQLSPKEGKLAKYYKHQMKGGGEKITKHVIEEIKLWDDLQTYLTNLWKKRGIIWED